MNPVYKSVIDVTADAIDANGHVNNVTYVQWMQDVAIRHSNTVGGDVAAREAGGTWVVRAHHVEYLASAFAGERIEVSTWVADFRRVRSLRKYEFRRESDGVLLVRGETDWVFVHVETGRPLAITPGMIEAFTKPLPNSRFPEVNPG